MSKNKMSKINDASTDAIKGVSGEQDPNSVVGNTTVKGPSETAGTIEASKTKDEIVPKNVFNTKQAAELVGGEATPAGAISGAITRAAGQIRYGGSADGISGDMSATVRGDRVIKSGDRPGRQQDYPLQKIDEAPAETYVVPIDTIPMLKDGPSHVGYNGNYRNTHQISQKGAGGVPCDSDFFRTLDEQEYDIQYFGEGQMNIPNNTEGTRAATLTAANWDTSGEGSYGEDFHTTLGNYKPTRLEVTFNANGVVSDLQIVADDITPPRVTENEYRRAGDAFVRYNNIAEADRLAMIEKAGNETKDNVSPLGKAIRYASGTNRILREMEGSIADTLFLSTSKLARALAYQNNKAAKDGLRKIGPMFEMTEALIEGNTVRYASHDELGLGGLFNNAANLRNGSAALYIAINDSTRKYNTKGKMLSLPQSFKQALSVAKQNLGVFRAHEDFINEFKRQESFGKINNDGSGVSPYYLSDGASVTWNVPLHQMTGITPSNDGVTEVNPLFTIHYEDNFNRYNEPIYNYFVAGLLDWFNRHGNNIVQACGYGTANRLQIPITSTVTSISLWDLIVCDAMKDIAIHRRYAMNILVDYEIIKGNGYPYSKLVPFNFDDTISLPGVQFKGIEYPLTPVNIPLNVAVRLILPEVFVPLAGVNSDRGESAHDDNCIVVKTLLPFYFNQAAFSPVHAENGYKWVDNPDGMDSMTFFDFRGGVSFDQADRIKAMDPEQLKFCLDRMITIPGKNKQSTNNEKFDCTVYKYAYHEDGIPTVNYNAYYYDNNDHAEILTIADILKTPRELGLSFIAPAGVITPMETATGANYRNLNSSYLGVSGPSFRTKMWHSAENVVDDLFANMQPRNGVAANLRATYCVIEATPYSINSKDYNGFRLSASHAGQSTYVSPLLPLVRTNDLTGQYDDDEGVYIDRERAITPAGDEYYANVSFASALKLLYMRLQAMPVIINPYDVNTFDLSQVPHQPANADRWTVLSATDVFDFLHLFNMCGFRCGEYSGTCYDRNQARIELGLGYTEDPYILNRL